MQKLSLLNHNNSIPVHVVQKVHTHIYICHRTIDGATADHEVYRTPHTKKNITTSGIYKR